MSSANDHHLNCDWQFEQYEHECNCGAAVLRQPRCLKCNLAASSLLHRFCTHADCPVRAALAARKALR